MTTLILASGSPRRTEILSIMGVPHEVQSSSVDEKSIAADHPRTFALRAAFAKAKDVCSQVEEGRWVLAADTVVTRNMLLYGKPHDAVDARRILASLAGESHEVITAIALCQSGTPHAYLRSETTRVQFRPLTAAEIEEYVASGEPMDKAGAYGIQGLGGELISHIDGDYFNVVGLPCQSVADVLEEAGLELKVSVPNPPDRWQ